MLYEHHDPAFLVRYARVLIDAARQSDDTHQRDALLTEANRATTAAERIIKGGKPVVIPAEVA